MADNTNTCPGCGTKFSTFKWKHQCHRCSAVRCHDCSSHKMPIPKLGITKPERVCDLCYIALNLAMKNTADLENFPVKTLKQFAIEYNVPAALTNALEKSDIISGLLRHYDPNRDKTHERALKDKVSKKDKKKQQKSSAAEYPGNVHANNYNAYNNVNSAQRPQQPNPQPHQNRSDNFFDNFAGFFNGGSPNVQNTQQQQQYSNSSSTNNNIGGGFDGFFDNLFGSIFPDHTAHPFNPPQQQQSATASTNVHYGNGAYSTNNRGSVGAQPQNNYYSAQQQNSTYAQPNVNTNYGNNGYFNGSNGQPQQQSAPQQPAQTRTDPAPQAPVSEVVIPENFELNELSVAQLKEILKRHRVDFKDCVEKADLIQKIRDRIMQKTSEADKKPASTNNNNNVNYDTNYSAYSHSHGGSAEDKDICVICQDRHIKCVFLECGHLACCMECSVKVQHCPLCRKYITRVVEIYHAYK